MAPSLYGHHGEHAIILDRQDIAYFSTHCLLVHQRGLRRA